MAVVGGKVSRIDAKTQSVTVTGTVDRVSFESQGNLLYLRAPTALCRAMCFPPVFRWYGAAPISRLSDVVGGQVTMTVVNGW